MDGAATGVGFGRSALIAVGFILATVPCLVVYFHCSSTLSFRTVKSIEKKDEAENKE